MLPFDQLARDAKALHEIVSILLDGKAMQLLADIRDSANIARAEAEKLQIVRNDVASQRSKLTEETRAFEAQKTNFELQQKQHDDYVRQHQGNVDKWRSDSAVRGADLDDKEQRLTARQAILDDKEEHLARLEQDLSARKIVLEKREKTVAKRINVLNEPVG